MYEHELSNTKTKDDAISLINQIKHEKSSTEASQFLIELFETTFFQKNTIFKNTEVLLHSVSTIPLEHFVHYFFVPYEPEIIYQIRLHFHANEAFKNHDRKIPICVSNLLWIQNMDIIQRAIDDYQAEIDAMIYIDLASHLHDNVITFEFVEEFILNSLEWNLSVFPVDLPNNHNCCFRISYMFHEFFCDIFRSQKFRYDDVRIINLSKKIRKIDDMHGCDCVMKCYLSEERSLERNPPMKRLYAYEF